MPRNNPAEPVVTGNLKNVKLLERRRKELVKCATVVFVEQRFDQASVNDIAERCGWSIGSLYRYVSSKEDILVLVCDEIFRNLSIDSIVATAGDDPIGSYEGAFGSYCDNVQKNHDQVLLMYREYTQLPADAQMYFRRRESDVYDALAAIVRDGVAQGVFTCEDPGLFAIDAVTSAHALALKRWALDRRSYKETRQHLVNWSLRGLGVSDRGPL